MAEPDLNDLRTTILRACPELAASRFTLLNAGWDSLAVDVDDRLIFKFPRHAEAEGRLRLEASLLAEIAPRVAMPVPRLTLYFGPPLFSYHAKLRGAHLLTDQYAALPETARERLADDLARFYAELHALDAARMAAAGAQAIRPWIAPEDMLRRVWPALRTNSLRHRSETAVITWAALPADPHGTTYGFFDGHGWNMAFDHDAQRLNGVYDFADSGFGPLQQDFIYSNFISRDLTARIIRRYEALTGRAVDAERVELLSAILRLSELAEYADDPAHAPAMVRHVADWFDGA